MAGDAQNWTADHRTACEYHLPGRAGLPAGELAAHRSLRRRLPGWTHTIRRQAAAPHAWQHVWQAPPGDERRVAVSFVGLVESRDEHGREIELNPAGGPWFSVAEVERVMLVLGVAPHPQP